MVRGDVDATRAQMWVGGLEVEPTVGCRVAENEAQCSEDITALLLAGGMHVEIMKITGVRGVASHCGTPVRDTKTLFGDPPLHHSAPGAGVKRHEAWKQMLRSSSYF